MDTDLLSYPTIDNLRCTILEFENTLRSEGQCIRVWEDRLNAVKAVEALLYPASSTESRGYYSTQNFPLCPIGTDNERTRILSISSTVVVSPTSSYQCHASSRSFSECEDSPNSSNDSSAAIAPSAHSRNLIAQATVTTGSNHETKYLVGENLNDNNSSFVQPLLQTSPPPYC